LEEKIKIDAFKGDGKCELADNEDFPFLSIDSLANRTKLVKSNLLLGITGPDIEVPIDPHWSRFEEVVKFIYCENLFYKLRIKPILIGKLKLLSTLILQK
jgi:hypothetical protein